MGGEQAQARILWQDWRLLQLSLVMVGVIVASACGSTESSVPTRGAGEEQGPLPTPENSDLGVVDPIVEEAHRYYDDARRMALRGKWKEAIEQYDQAIALDPNNWRAYYYRGASYFSLRHLQQALEDFERVIALQPHIAGAYFSRGVLRWLGGQCAEALNDFQVFIALSDDQEAFFRGQRYMEYPLSTVQCEPPPDAQSLVAIRAWHRAPRG